MANFNGTARTNYFRVKDYDKFVAWIDTLGETAILQGGVGGRVGFYSTCPDTGAFTNSKYDNALEDFVEIDLIDELAEHLMDGEVAVLMEAGAEKLRYVSGWATAVNSQGESVNVSLNDIYQLAATKFFVPLDSITLAEY